MGRERRIPLAIPPSYAWRNSPLRSWSVPDECNHLLEKESRKIKELERAQPIRANRGVCCVFLPHSPAIFLQSIVLSQDKCLLSMLGICSCGVIENP
jgi:hypothetical protein